jgi:segregation and condensation protein B
LTPEVPKIEAVEPADEPVAPPAAELEAVEASDEAAAEAPAEAPAAQAPEPPATEDGQGLLPETLPPEELRLAILEAVVYVAEEPLTLDQLADGLSLPRPVVEADMTKLAERSAAADRGVEIRRVAGGYKMFTKAEHHEAVRGFVKSLQPKLKLSRPALETLAVIAYKQPITLPEIQAIRGVNASGTIHTLLKHKLVANAGRKRVVGKPMMYKTTREFLVQFGLDDLSELPNLKEFEELTRAAIGDEEPAEPEPIGEVDTETLAEDFTETDEPEAAEPEANLGESVNERAPDQDEAERG